MINIRPITNGYVITFSGDKNVFNQHMNTFNQVKSRRYSLVEKGWVVPNLDEVNKAFNLIKQEDNENYKDMGNNLKLVPYVYQKEAIKFCLDNPSSLLVLPCGAGKSAIIIGTFDEMVNRKMIKQQGLVVVKSSLKFQWKKEVEKFSNYTVNIIKTKSDLCLNEYNRIKSRENKLKKLKPLSKEYKAIKQEIMAINQEIDEKFDNQFNYDLLVTNYETVKNDDVKNKLHKLKLDFVASDEVHTIKSHKADRSKAMYEFGEAKVTIGATATPVQKNYEDIYGLFKFIKPDLWSSHSKFAALYIKYAGPGIISGFKNIDQLREKINPYIFIKTKEEISSQLPSLNVIQRYCTLDDKVVSRSQEIFEEIKALREQERQIIAKCPTEKAIENNSELKQVDAKIMALQTFAQELADEPELLIISESDLSKQYYVKIKQNPKMELVYNIVEEIIESGEKVCIFSRFERMQSFLAEKLSKINKSLKIAFINGSMNDEKRYDEVYNKFKDNDDYKILLASDAGSTGLNLSKCKYIIEYDLADSYAIQTQRHGRIERSDSIHENVFVYQLIGNDSYDEIAFKIVSKKEGYDYELIKRLKE